MTPGEPQLVASFEKRFAARGGATIRCELARPAEGFSVTVLFGPSGCGKTTVLRCLAGLERPEAGHIRFGDQTWFDADRRAFLTPQQRGIGFLFQDYALFPHLTVAQNIAYGLAAQSKTERSSRVAEMLAALQLDGLAARLPSQLSGGQQQRVALARAVARKPQLLLLDEPLSALDAPTRAELRRELRRILRGFARPAVLVTHDPMEAMTLADHVVVMHEGRVKQSGPVEEVFSRPVDPQVARIVGVETVLRGRVAAVAGGVAIVAIGPATLAAAADPLEGEAVDVCIRGEDVIVQRAAPGEASSARNRLAGRVRAVTPDAGLVRVEIDCGFPLTALVTRPAAEELKLAEGEAVVAVVKATAVHLIPRGR